MRNVLNYGHSFGHAIESATEFAIPHGIAVSMGMDMANFVACQLGKTTLNEFARMHPTLHKNYRDYRSTPVPFEKFLGAIARDKKNTAADLKLVLPVDSAKGAAQIEIVLVANDERFQRACRQYFEKARLA